MSEEKEKAMSLSFKDVPLNGEPVKIKLDCAKAVKSGQSKNPTWDDWHLWFGYVENFPKVYDRNESTGKYTVLVENYTGKVSFLPTQKLNDQLEQLTAGNIGVEVNIKKIAEEGPKGLVKKYIAEKLSDGEAPASSMTVTESKLVNDTINLIKSGFTIEIGDFVKASQAEMYEGKISEERAKALYYIMKKM